MKILVCGGRDYWDYLVMHEVLGEYLADDLVIIHGGARGADDLADKWAEENGVATEVYPAQWEKYGKRAGTVRNAAMLSAEKPDLVIAFRGGRGTANMINLAEKAGVPVQRVGF